VPIVSAHFRSLFRFRVENELLFSALISFSAENVKHIFGRSPPDMSRQQPTLSADTVTRQPSVDLGERGKIYSLLPGYVRHCEALHFIRCISCRLSSYSGSQKQEPTLTAVDVGSCDWRSTMVVVT